MELHLAAPMSILDEIPEAMTGPAAWVGADMRGQPGHWDGAPWTRGSWSFKLSVRTRSGA